MGFREAARAKTSERKIKRDEDCARKRERREWLTRNKDRSCEGVSKGKRKG